MNTEKPMTYDEKVAFVRRRGWGTWYHPNYWVNEKTITDPQRQDYTNYGMSLDDAVRWEQEGRAPIPPGNDLGTIVNTLRALDGLARRFPCNAPVNAPPVPETPDQ